MGIKLLLAVLALQLTFVTPSFADDFDDLSLHEFSQLMVVDYPELYEQLSEDDWHKFVVEAKKYEHQNDRDILAEEFNAKDIAETSLHYTKAEIATERYGDNSWNSLMQKAYSFTERVKKKIVGQDNVISAVQNKLVQYLDNWGHRTKDPVAIHLIGLSGIGKSAIIEEVEALGITVLKFDAQTFSKEANFADKLAYSLKEVDHDEKPVVVIIEETDKQPEIVDGQEVKEESSSLIGTLNQILTDGRMSSPYGEQLDVSNVMFISTLNFSPKEISEFSKDVLGKEKSFYDYDFEDLKQFNQWIRQGQAAVYKILSRIFRTNTVGRMAPNTVIMNSLSEENYRQISQIVIDNAIARATEGENAKSYLKVNYSNEFLSFIADKTTFIPSGARETVLRADAMTAQLIEFAKKFQVGSKDSLGQPREVHIDYDSETQQTVVTVEVFVVHNKKLKKKSEASFAVNYEEDAKSYMAPEGLVISKPEYASRAKAKSDKADKPPTKKAIYEARFPKTQTAANGLAARLNEKLVDQEKFTELTEKEMRVYLGREGAAKKEPQSMVLSGFPGIGKSALVELTAEDLGLPVVRINMQEYSSDSDDAVSNFVAAIQKGVARAREESKTGKYLLVIEELDKVFEISPDGVVVNRPVMAIIKDLFNNGQVEFSTTTEYGSSRTTHLDVRDAFVFGTMNFSVDRFGFTADPRQTTIEKVMKAYKSITARIADLKKLLGTMFLPETVSRLLPRFHVMGPLTESGYRRLIDMAIELAASQRLLDDKGNNRLQIEVKTTPAYRRYLFDETVIPSEGARNTVMSVNTKVSTALEETIKRIPRSSKYAKVPVNIILDYKPGKHEVVGYIERQDEPGQNEEMLRAEVALQFPSIEAKGRVSQERMRVSLHEFGHAYMAMMLGVRVRYVQVVSPSHGVGGYVEPNDTSQSAKSMMSHVYITLASRAMERIFLSENPEDSSSVLDITSGPSQDIKMAMMAIYNMIYQLGFNPTGATMDRLGIINGQPYANFESMPTELVERLGMILREMENLMVSDFLKMHNLDWYKDKITKLARKGGMLEEEFYELTGHPHPGDVGVNLADDNILERVFDKEVHKTTSKVKKARNFKQGNLKLTAQENVDRYTEFFAQMLDKYLNNEHTSECEVSLDSKKK